MQKLYINGVLVGSVKGYRKRGGGVEAWSFLMDGGFYVSVEIANIKVFTSSGDLEIITYG